MNEGNKRPRYLNEGKIVHDLLSFMIHEQKEKNERDNQITDHHHPHTPSA